MKTKKQKKVQTILSCERQRIISRERLYSARMLELIDKDSPTTGELLINLLCEGASGERFARECSQLTEDPLLDIVLKTRINAFAESIQLIETNLRLLHGGESRTKTVKSFPSPPIDSTVNRRDNVFVFSNQSLHD